MGCNEEPVPPLPRAAAAIVEPVVLPEEGPPDPLLVLGRALDAAVLLEEMIRIAKVQRSSPNLEHSTCMMRFSFYRPQREGAVQAFHELPEGTPGAEDLSAAALETAFCINCHPLDELRCAEAERLRQLGLKKLKTVTKGLR